MNIALFKKAVNSVKAIILYIYSTVGLCGRSIGRAMLPRPLRHVSLLLSDSL